MKRDVLLGGSGGGGGGYRNRPDNLRSTDTFEALIGISSSRTKLAPGGLKNLYLNGVPVEDGQGNASFTDFSAILFDGNPAVLEPVTLRLGQSGGQTQVNLTLSNTYTEGTPGDWKNAAITTPGVDFIDLRFVVQALYNQTKDGVFDQTATLEIQLQPSGTSTWINPLLDVSAPTYSPLGFLSGVYSVLVPQVMWFNPSNTTNPTWAEANPGKLVIRGKTTSPYVKELRIAVPNTGVYSNKTWAVRARLIEKDYAVTGDNGENEYRRTIVWDAIAGVSAKQIGGTEAWRGLSHLTIYGKATDQISGIPEMTGVYDLGEHRVPPTTVWDPSTRIFTGEAWDGVTTQVAWTQCPAWQIKGLIEDSLSGVSALAPGSTLNKWDALEASKWFSERVPDGKGGYHARYSANWFLEQPMPVHELVNYLAGAVGGFCWDEGNGVWRMKVEKPEAPSMVFTKENIVGEFIYQHTEFDSRYNRLTGVFRNEENLYNEDRVSVYDQTDIDQTGTRHTSIALVGCTNRQEALRRLKIRLLTGLYETKVVTFTTNRMGLLLEPFSVIAVADADLNPDSALRSTGRILTLNAARTEIGLRDTLRLELGVSYKLHVTVPNPAYTPETTSQPASTEWRKPTITITRNIVNTTAQRGDVKTVYLDQALPENVPANANFALEAVGLPALPKSYRVTSLQLSEGNPDQVVITATEIYANKWVESDNVVENEPVSQSVSRVVPPPTAPSTGMFAIREFTSTVGTQRFLVVSWDRPISTFIDNYKVEYSHNNGPWQSLGDTRETFYELADPLQGNHQFRIYTRDRRGALSEPLTGSVDLDQNFLIVPTPILTNPAAVVSADSDGAVTSFETASGQYQLRYPSGPITSGVTYSVVSVTGGLAISIDTVGNYTVTGLSSDAGSATLRAVYGEQTFDQVYTLSKARSGTDGVIGNNGINVATVSLYQRTLTNTAPSLVRTGSTTYTFATGAVTGQPTGWVNSIPDASSGGFLWVIQATASSVDPTDVVANTEWSTPRLFTQNGADGLKTALVYIYQRSTSTPTLPSANATYTFDTYALTGLNNGWSATIPTGSYPLYVAVASSSGTAATDTITPGDWSTPVVLAKNGTDGQPGVNTAVVSLYQRTQTNSAPSVATTGSATYTFATGAITGQPSNWLNYIPPNSGGPYLWVIRASAINAAATDLISNTEWSTPVTMSQDGINAMSSMLLPESLQVASYANGGVTNYSNLSTTMTIWAGMADVSTSFTLSVVNNPQGLTTSITDRTVTVTGAGSSAGQFGNTGVDTATLTIRATGAGIYSSVSIDKVLTLSKVRGGYEIVSTLPATNLFTGRVVFLTTDNKLYRYNGTTWTSSVDGGDLISGTIGSAALKVGMGKNMLVGSYGAGANPNNTLLLFINDGIPYQTNGATGQYFLSPAYGANWPGTQWTLSDNSTMALRQTNGLTGTQGFSDFIFRQITNPATGSTPWEWDVEPGKYYEFSLYTACHRCSAACYIHWVDANNAIISATALDTNNSTATTNPANGSELSNYVRLVTRGQAPANARRARLVVRKYHTTQGYGFTDSWLFFARPMLAETVEGATEAIPWSPSPISVVSGDIILAGSVATNQLAAGAVTAAKLNVTELSAITANIGLLRTATTGARTEISNNKIEVYDANGVKRVQLGIW